MGIVVTDTAAGEVLFTETNHGFEVNGRPTVTCTHAFDDETTVAVTAFFTPAKK